MIRNILLTAIFLLSSQAAMAQQDPTDQFKEGTHYFKIKRAQAPSNDDSVEVMVVFSYYCGHCNTLEPYIESWAQKKPDNVKMDRMHVNFGGVSTLMARGYITAEMTGIADASHRAMMDAIWKQKKRFRNAEQLADFYAAFGVERGRFMSNFKSFAADSQLRRVDQNTQLWGITGTPTIVINRKYRVPNTSSVWEVVDYLVAKETVIAKETTTP
jgi:thiol:disulfide interchange protein DsbA